MCQCIEILGCVEVILTMLENAPEIKFNKILPITSFTCPYSTSKPKCSSWGLVFLICRDLNTANPMTPRSITSTTVHGIVN